MIQVHQKRQGSQVAQAHQKRQGSQVAQAHQALEDILTPINIDISTAPKAIAVGNLTFPNVSYNYGLFIDNASIHIKEVCTDIFVYNMTCINVKETPFIRPTVQSLEKAIKYVSSDASLKDNLYYKIVTTHGGGVETFDEVSGVQQDHEKNIKSWLETTKGKRVAIFDWDRTITMFEGFLDLRVSSTQAHTVVDIENNPQKFLEDMLIYLCGGVTRLNFIRRMLYNLYLNNVDIIILTNNKACGTLPLFPELVMKLMNKIPIKAQDKIGYYCICAAKPIIYEGRLTTSHKGKALKNVIGTLLY